MSRIQLALNVPDLDAAVVFYTTLFGTAPHKRRDGYANFAISDPPLKLVLFESAAAEALNHLGIEVDSTSDVATATRRLADAGLEVDVRDQETCCHATQDKVWIDGPAAQRWEVYAITDDAPQGAGVTACCASTDDAPQGSVAVACC